MQTAKLSTSKNVLLNAILKESVTFARKSQEMHANMLQSASVQTRNVQRELGENARMHLLITLREFLIPARKLQNCTAVSKKDPRKSAELKLSIVV